MSYKGTDVENKSSVPMPRELTQLLTLTQELREACGLRAKDRIASLIPEVEQAWSRVNRLQLATSAQGGSIGDNMAILEACATALNAATETKARGHLLTTGLGASYT